MAKSTRRDPGRQSFDAIPPHDEAAEAGVLGSMLCDARAARAAVELVTEADFYAPRYQLLFGLFRDLHERSGDVDLIEAQNELRRRGLAERVGGIEILGRLIEDTPNAANVERYCRIVRERAHDRGILQGAVRAQQHVAEGIPAVEVLAALEGDLAKVREALPSSAAPRTLAQWLASPEMLEPVPRISTGYKDLDAALGGGLVPGGLYVVAGVTSGGKSTFVTNICRRAALDGTRTLLVTLEDLGIQVARKVLAASSMIPLRQVERIFFDKHTELARLKEARSALDDVPLLIDGETSRLDALEVALAGHARQGVRMVAVDQMSWIQAEGDTPFQRAVTISRRTKELARRTGLVLVLVCQVNRAGSKNDHGPSLYDLRDSGTIEQDSDGVLLLKRVDFGDKGRPDVLELEVAKHRHGPRGEVVRLTWFPWESRLESWIPSDSTGVRV